MADNVAAASGDGLGPNFATDDIGGVHYPKTKIVWGASDAATQVAVGAAAVPIQDGGNSITVDVGAALPAGANNIGDVDVLSLPALPAGTNNIGDVDIASIAAGDNNIGNVDIISLPAADAQNIADIEAHVSRLTTGTAPINGGAATATTALAAAGTYNATPPTLTNAQQCGLQLDASGALKISGGGTGVEYTEGDTDASITGKALLWEDVGDVLRAASAAKPLPVNIIAGAGSGGTASTDDAAFTPAVGSGTPMMGLVTADAVDSGDVGVIAILANRQQKVTLYDSGGVELAVGGGTQYDEDSVHASGDKVTMAGAVRSDTAAAKAGTDGDRTVLITDANGRLHVVTEHGAATLTSLQLLDDAIKSDDSAFVPTSDKVLMIGAEADETAADAVDEGDAGALRMTLNRGLHVNLRSASGVELAPSQDAVHDSAALTTGPQIMAVAATTAPTAVTAGDAVRAWALPNGALAVNIRDAAGDEVSIGGGTQYTEDAAAATNPVGNALLMVRDDARGGSLVTANGDNVAARGTDFGELYVKHVDVVSVSPAGNFAVQDAVLAGAAILDDSTFIPTQTTVLMGGFTADETSVDSVDEGDGGAARMTLDRKQIVVNQGHAQGGLSIHRSIDLDEGALEVVKASPGCLYGMWVANLATATRFIKFYDATSGTVGTGTPVLTIPIPGNATDDIAGSFGPGGVGIQFATGICVGASTGIADADTGAPGANDVVVNIFYK